MTFEEALQECHQELLKQKEVVWYLELKERIKNNPEIQELVSKTHYYQRQMTLNYDNNERYQEMRRQFLDYQRKYDEHPLIQNLKVLQEQIYDLLMQIKTIIEN